MTTLNRFACAGVSIWLIIAIKVLLGPAWDFQVDEISRTIQIVQIGDTALQVLNADAH
jgi:hypothetical protein